MLDGLQMCLSLCWCFWWCICYFQKGLRLSLRRSGGLSARSAARHQLQVQCRLRGH
jgi:hypothetical protein